MTVAREQAIIRGHQREKTTNGPRHEEKSQQAAMGRIEVVTADQKGRRGGEEVQRYGTDHPPEEDARLDVMRGVSAVIRPVYK